MPPANNDKNEMEKAAEDEKPTAEVFDPFVGGEEDDLSDMEYMQDETKSSVDTHPPETKADAEARKEQEKPREDRGDVVPDAEKETKAEDETEKETEEVKPEAEAEAEAESEPEEPESEEDNDESPSIPKHRFDEINERMKKAEERAKLLEEKLNDLAKPKDPEPEPFDFAAKEKEAANALLEGDEEKYAELRTEIRAAEREEYLREAKKLASEGDEKVQTQLSLQEVGAKIEADYPQFVEGSDKYNGEAYDELMELYVGYMGTGKYSEPEALQKAADKTVKIYGFGEEAEADNVVPIRKKKPDVKKKTDAAGKQPPVMESSAQQEQDLTVNIATMSDEEFDALPDSKKRELRGDIV